MKHRFLVTEFLDAPLPVVVAAYLDCEHYVYLHRALSECEPAAAVRWAGRRPFSTLTGFTTFLREKRANTCRTASLMNRSHS